MSSISWPYMHEFIPGLLILFHWFKCLFLCQYHTVLITIDLWYSLKSGSVTPPALLFFLKIALAIQNVFVFPHDYYEGFFSIFFMKNTIRILIGIALILWIGLGSMGIFLNVLLPIHEHRIFFHLFVTPSIYFIKIL